MRGDKYFFIFFAMVASFIGLMLLVPSVIELVVLYVLMIIAYVVLLSEYNNEKWAAGVASVFFLIKVINILIVYFMISHSGLFPLLFVIDIFGFLVSISEIKSHEKEEESFEEEALAEKYQQVAEEIKPITEETPEVFVEKVEPEFSFEEKKTVKKRAKKKKVKRKKPKKKTKKRGRKKKK